MKSSYKNIDAAPKKGKKHGDGWAGCDTGTHSLAERTCPGGAGLKRKEPSAMDGSSKDPLAPTYFPT